MLLVWERAKEYPSIGAPDWESKHWSSWSGSPDGKLFFFVFRICVLSEETVGVCGCVAVSVGNVALIVAGGCDLCIGLLSVVVSLAWVEFHH